MKSPIQIKNNQIVITKAFAKNAYCFGTPEYEMLQTVRRDYPEFKVVLREIKKNTNVDHYKGLNYEYMKWYIGQYETQEKKDLMLKALDKLIDISKCHSTGKRYATIRNWFLDNYPAVKRTRRTRWFLSLPPPTRLRVHHNFLMILLPPRSTQPDLIYIKIYGII